MLMLAMSFALRERYVLVAGLSAIVWDIIIHIPQDSELLLNSKLSLPNSVFLLSRIATLGLAAATLVFSAGTGATCHYALNAATSFFVISVRSTSLLFVFRARAVFLGNNRATGGFLALWALAACTCFAQLFRITASRPRLGSGGGCGIEGMQPSCISCLVTAVTNDMLVFALTSWKILTFVAAEEGFKSCVAYFCGRDGLPLLSRVILRTGQQYFLLTVTIKVLGAAVMHAPSIPTATSVSILIPLIALENAMGCKVFRDIKVGVGRCGGSISNIPSPSRPIQFALGALPSGSWDLE